MQIPVFQSADEYNRAIGVGAPHFGFFDIKRFEENMPVVKRVMPAFRLNLFEIALKLSGGGTVAQVQHDQPADLPMLFFTYPGLIHGWEIVPDWKGYYIAFATDFVGLAHANTATLRDFPFFKQGYQTGIFLREEEASLLAEVFERIHTEYHSPSVLSLDIIRAHVFALLQYSRRFHALYVPDQPENGVSELTRKFQARLEAHVDALLSGREPLKGVAEFASDMAVHPDHLSKILKQDTGSSALQLIQTRLLTEAKALLKHTQWDVAQIAFRLGYQDPAYFARVFRKAEGKAPTEWRLMA